MNKAGSRTATNEESGEVLNGHRHLSVFSRTGAFLSAGLRRYRTKTGRSSPKRRECFRSKRNPVSAHLRKTGAHFSGWCARLDQFASRRPRIKNHRQGIAGGFGGL